MGPQATQFGAKGPRAGGLNGPPAGARKKGEFLVNKKIILINVLPPPTTHPLNDPQYSYKATFVLHQFKSPLGCWDINFLPLLPIFTYFYPSPLTIHPQYPPAPPMTQYLIISNFCSYLRLNILLIVVIFKFVPSVPIFCSPEKGTSMKGRKT